MVDFSQATKDQIKIHISKYPEGKQKSALISILHVVQKENKGWLSVPVMDKVAEILQIQPIEVYEVASFYTMFNLNPVGAHVLEVCRTGPCMIVGAEKIVDHIKNRLGINDGETTEDGLFTLKTVECLGACGYAPMLQLGDDYREHLTIEKVDQLIEELRGR